MKITQKQNDPWSTYTLESQGRQGIIILFYSWGTAIEKDLLTHLRSLRKYVQSQNKIMQI